jgi:plastocyanin
MKFNPKRLLGLGLAWFLCGVGSGTSYAYQEIVVKNGATIRGTVRYDGAVPTLPPLEITKYKEMCRDVPNESLVLGPDQGVRYAVITIEGITRGKAVERESVHELDNIQCRFSPHVQAASVGQFVLIKNSDPILHTAHAIFTKHQPQFNVGLYPGRVSRKPLIAPGIATIRCDVHPWMIGFIVVTEHPYHAVSDLYGEYRLTDVPPGVYRLKLWHESLGTQEKRIEVKPAATQTVDFTFSPSREVKR